MVGGVAGLLHVLRQQLLLQRQRPDPAASLGRVVVLEAGADHVSPGHDAGARRGADGLGIEGVELHAGVGQAVHVRRWDLPAVVADIVVAVVVLRASSQQ